MAGSHEAIGWLRPDSDLGLAVAAARLIERLPVAQVLLHAHSVSVSFSGWEVWFHLAEAGYVAEETQEFASMYPDNPRADLVRECCRRIEVECSEADPQGLHRRDFQAVCAVLAEFRGVLLRDPVEGAWL